ncbi:hypothetical protein EG68_00067 [Paragonimus skrjabini miyazakii]|uniref:Uncharacterized protein n=1 Tax=Paragonimus skrjabini miyazakii TaxID=59628 RepID=A0A8S9Z7L6_9TREM|nr:hypothetical protein EG68_00067 [Paragonimus skrjabini miyazakii]
MKRIKFGEEFIQPDLRESGSDSEIVPEPDSLDDSEFVVKTPDEAYFTFHNTAPEPEICRFTIPMDLKNLEGMTVMQYLRTCTRISPPRIQLYDKTFHSWSHGSTISREKTKSSTHSGQTFTGNGGLPTFPPQLQQPQTPTGIGSVF